MTEVFFVGTEGFFVGSRRGVLCRYPGVSSSVAESFFVDNGGCFRGQRCVSSSVTEEISSPVADEPADLTLPVDMFGPGAREEERVPILVRSF